MENSLPISCPNCKAENKLFSEDGRIIKYCRTCGSQIAAKVVASRWRKHSYRLSVSRELAETAKLTGPLTGTNNTSSGAAAPKASKKYHPVLGMASPAVRASAKQRFAGKPISPFGLLTAFQQLHKPVLVVFWLVVTVIVILVPYGRDDRAIAEAKPTATATPELKPTPITLPPEIDPKEGVYVSKITTPSGDTGTFEVVLLSKQYVWVQRSENTIKQLGNIKVHGELAFSTTLRDRIKDAAEVIVVGTADILGKNRRREEVRANDRSQTLFDVVSKIKGTEHNVFQLPLGQWEGPTDVSLDDQRRVLLINVRNRTAGMPLSYGVRKTLEEHQEAQPVFKDILYNYSKSDNLQIR